MVMDTKKRRDSRCSLIMTTDSPYVTAALNNMLFAGKNSGENNGKRGIDRIFRKELQLHFDDVSAYFLADGGCESMLDQESRSINPEKLNSCSHIINAEYDKMESIIFNG